MSSASVLLDSNTEPIPLVAVPGFFGTATFASWAHILQKTAHDPLRQRRIIIPSLGPVSSLHDRACELYYSLLGGTVDYGEEHSSTHQHSRYGRMFPNGLYPVWSKEKPLHFLGYSVGGPTVVKLQDLLQQGHFGENAHPDMILSLNAVCAPFRGTQLVYALGESLTAAPEVRPLSIGAFLARLVHIVAYFAPLLPCAFDFHADARSLSFCESSVASFVKQLWRSDWAESKDAAPYDMTFEAAETREDCLEGRVHPNTCYRSHVSVMTYKVPSFSKSYQCRPPMTFSFTHILLYIPSTLIGTFNYHHIPPSRSFSQTQRLEHENFRDAFGNGASKTENISVPECHVEECLANDGVVPIFSQWHPLPCAITTCSHSEVLGLKFYEEKPVNKKHDLDHHANRPVRGEWVVTTVQDTNHLSPIVSPFKNTAYQKIFWKELGQWLDTADTWSTQREPVLEIEE